ncbi:MAG: glycosyltransferase [Candidatus Methylomirabilales bacterium]
MLSLSVIIPVYNEGELIGKTLVGIEHSLKIPHEIVIIYDFEEDNTLQAIQLLQESMKNLRIVRNGYGRGVANAIKSGFAAARGEAIVVTMGDGSDDPGTIEAMYRKILEGFDLVCGSRYMDGGVQLGGPRMKRFLSRLAGLSLNLLTGIPTKDVTSAFKMYRKEIVERIDLESDGGFEISMELTVKAYFAGYRIGEVPTVWLDRSAGVSKFKMWKWLPRYLRWYYLALRSRSRAS